MQTSLVVVEEEDVTQPFQIRADVRARQVCLAQHAQQQFSDQAVFFRQAHLVYASVILLKRDETMIGRVQHEPPVRNPHALDDLASQRFAAA